MPFYEYQCPKCKKIIELLTSINDEEQKLCDSCEVKMKKLISKNNFHLKGSCWASDGYSKENQ